MTASTTARWNQATAWGLLAAAEKAGLELFLGSYPITPATEILQEITKRKHLGAIAFQAEDEIAAIGFAIGSSYAGKTACTITSGPGIALKTEMIGRFGLGFNAVYNITDCPSFIRSVQP